MMINIKGSICEEENFAKKKKKATASYLEKFEFGKNLNTSSYILPSKFTSRVHH